MARCALRRTAPPAPHPVRHSHERQAGARLRGRASVRFAGGRSGAGAGFALACALAVSALLPGTAASGVPASAGARVMPAGSWELVASLDMASHLRAGGSGAERVLIDGETWRQGLALRHGLGGGWELLADLPAVSHTGGVFDGFIEDWHDAFGLPQGDRDRAPRDRLALFYADGGGTRLDIDSDVHSLGDVSVGVHDYDNHGVIVGLTGEF